MAQISRQTSMDMLRMEQAVSAANAVEQDKKRWIRDTRMMAGF